MLFEKRWISPAKPFSRMALTASMAAAPLPMMQAFDVLRIFTAFYNPARYFSR
jgi:hypothetical protein